MNSFDGQHSRIAPIIVLLVLLLGGVNLAAEPQGQDLKDRLVRAQQGFVRDEMALADAYRQGQGVTADQAEAARWYRKAADSGDPVAQTQLGFMYIKGQGVPQDDHEALRWFQRAASEASVTAQYNLGLMYYEGRGVPRDDAAAVRYLNKAAKQGYPPAQVNLAVAYIQGWTEKKPRQALRLLEQAAQRDISAAYFGLGYLYDTGEAGTQDLARAADFYRRAAERGNRSAQHNLALMYLEGRGLPKDFAQALQWELRAAEQKNPLAYCALSRIYGEGLGVQPDVVATTTWLLLADKSGIDVSRALAEMLSAMSPENIVEARRRAQAWDEQHTPGK